MVFCRNLYAPRNPYVSGQAQFLEYPTTLTFQFVNPQVGANVLTNTNLPQLSKSLSIPACKRHFVSCNESIKQI